MKNILYVSAVFSVILFVILLFQFQSEAMISFDQYMNKLFEGNRFFGFFHYFGETALIITASLLLLVFLWIKARNYRGMLFVLLTVALGNVLNRFIKDWVGRPRPEIEDQLTSFSFPSGHAMLGLLYLFTIVYLTTENLVNEKRKLFIWIGTTILVILIGLSRIAESRHFGTDVLAGWFLGYAWFVVCVIWYERRVRRFNKMS